MNKQIEIYKRLHGKHICQHPGCRTMCMGDFCMEHLEAAVARQWSELETGEAVKLGGMLKAQKENDGMNKGAATPSHDASALTPKLSVGELDYE